jgi:hypothetical protein
VIQYVTIPEYFNTSRDSQKNLDDRRYSLAKEHLMSTGLLSTRDLRTFVLDYAEEHKSTISAVLAYFALRRLNHIIEEDLMEYVAELGVNTLKAVREDDAERMDSEEFFQLFGYENKSEISVTDELEGITDLYIVQLVDKPITIYTLKPNPFLPPGNFSIKDLDSMAKDNADSRKKDYDKMTEEEWQQAKDDEEAAKVAEANQKAYKLLEAANNEAVENYKLRKKKKEADYPDWVAHC